MNKINKIVGFLNKNRVPKHLLFWVLILALNIPKGLIEHSEPLYKLLVHDTSFLISQVLSSYYFAYLVIPYFLEKKKYLNTFVLVFIGFYFFSALSRVFMVHVSETLVREGIFEQESIMEILLDWKKLLIHYMPNVFSVTLIFLFVKYLLDYNKEIEKDLRFKKEKSETEIKILKAQLNPHFLFNTLNNIYSLSVDNSPKTSASIGKLSEILDHVLYRCNDKFVSLSSEVELLENYIELEKLRYDDRLQVSFTSEIENDIEIPPLILLSLVENAFKHGAGEDSGSPKIDIHISKNQKRFVFNISNTVSKEYQSNNEENIGLTNIKKQLDLIYQEGYSLDIDCSKSIFTVVLKINQI